jgi:hypothetical protein
VFVPRYTEEEARRAVADSLCLTDVLRKLGLRPAGGNHLVLRKWLEAWGIDTRHFDPDLARLVNRGGRRATPLDEILVEGSPYSRKHLKARLYAAGLKQRRCELCGQGELWRGERMALVLDHINGVGDDNRLENLRIVCPNCAATFETHCGRHNRIERPARPCERCGCEFVSRHRGQRYCSRPCGARHPNRSRRKVERPSYAQLQADRETMSMLAIGRKYGVYLQSRVI